MADARVQIIGGKVRINGGRVATCAALCSCECVDCPGDLPSSYLLTGKRDGRAFYGLLEGGSCNAEAVLLWTDDDTNVDPPASSAFLVRSVGPCGWLLSLYTDLFVPGDDPRGPWPDDSGGGHTWTDLAIS